MRIMLDTNILISVFAVGGKVRETFNLLMTTNFKIYITEYVDAEFRRIVDKKFRQKSESIISKYESNNFEIYPSTNEILGNLRDEKDIPVLSDAIFHKVDILLTGDKDFLESGIENPVIMSPKILMEYLING